MPEDYNRFLSSFTPVTPAMAERLENWITDLESRIKMPDEFIIPAGNSGAACIDIARSTVRRAERRLVDLKNDCGLSNELIPGYINRLSDLLFTLARFEEQ